MDSAVITCVSFEQVQRELDGMHQVSFSEAEQLLLRASITTTHAALLNEYSSGKLMDIHGVDLFAERGTDFTPLEEAAYDVLARLFPCNVDAIFENMMEDETVPCILIDPVFKVSSEGFGDLVMEPDQFGDSPLTSLMIFVRYLDMGVDGHYFDMAAAHFGWSVDAPECCQTETAIDSINMKHFYDLLDEHSLGEFKLPFHCLAQETDNMFLDWTLDEVNQEFIPYSMPSIRNLVEEWASAQPRVEQLKAAAERFKQDRWIAPRIVELWDRCVRYKDGRLPRTLVEMWGVDAEGDVEVVSDEFYGPLGLEERDD
jgi:hypothetical protein